MSAPNASSSSSQLVSYAQDVDYTRTEGFKQFKARYNVKKARVARNDPNGVYPSPEVIYQAAKGPGMTERSLDSLSLDDFILAGSVSARRRLKHLSLAPYYAAQMKRCTQKWDRRDEQGTSSEAINVSRQLIGLVGMGLYHSMAEVQASVRSNCGSSFGFPLIDFSIGRRLDAPLEQRGDYANRTARPDRDLGGGAPLFQGESW